MELKKILEVKNLHFSYKNHRVLSGIDFELFEGEAVSLLGVNGCGKSTLIKLMLKLLEGKGEIKLYGKSLKNYSHKELSTLMAYIPQYNNTPFNYKVIDMVVMARVARLGFFSTPSRADYEKSYEMLSKIGIEDLAQKDFANLSGGQKQMVLIARAMAQESRVFLMDEPVAGLDYGNQIRLLELIDSLAKDGYTILKTTHYPDHALLVSSRVVIMSGGSVMADGLADDVITKKMIENIYGIEADIITHQKHKRCVPIFREGVKI